MIKYFGPATPEEIIYDLPATYRIPYRHFVHERIARNSHNGVQHREKSWSKVRIVDGKPFVVYQGKLHEITADVCTINGQLVTYDRRLKSEYLK